MLEISHNYDRRSHYSIIIRRSNHKSWVDHFFISDGLKKTVLPILTILMLVIISLIICQYRVYFVLIYVSMVMLVKKIIHLTKIYITEIVGIKPT